MKGFRMNKPQRLFGETRYIIHKIGKIRPMRIHVMSFPAQWRLLQPGNSSYHRDASSCWQLGWATNWKKEMESTSHVDWSLTLFQSWIRDIIVDIYTVSSFHSVSKGCQMIWVLVNLCTSVRAPLIPSSEISGLYVWWIIMVLNQRPTLLCCVRRVQSLSLFPTQGEYGVNHGTAGASMPPMCTMGINYRSFHLKTVVTSLRGLGLYETGHLLFIGLLALCTH